MKLYVTLIFVLFLTAMSGCIYEMASSAERQKQAILNERVIHHLPDSPNAIVYENCKILWARDGYVRFICSNIEVEVHGKFTIERTYNEHYLPKVR